MFLKKNGFTIIEVVVASIILVVSLLGGVVFLSANRNNLVYATNQRLATWSAIYKIEQLKSATYTDTGWDAILNNTFPGSTTENLPISGKSFIRKTTITDIGVGPDYKQATVEMNWGKPTPPVSLTTYISAK
jgi:prepilin-type N-terminal cleavage/methylation domain-containing protein